ncbi:MAG: Flp pilus assembly complex ATPase component TadA, partial [Myxococcales bacterium]|nr:Flp pilus assembly complex ATPase component TadA [Myxococcales bacterium]
EMGGQVSKQMVPLLRDPATRWQAMESLAKAETADSIPQLEELLFDPDARLRMDALEGLGFFRNAESLEILRNTAESDKSPQVRAYAAQIAESLSDAMDDAKLSPAERQMRLAKASNTREVDRLLIGCLRMGASDLYLGAGYPPSVRLNGVVQVIKNESALEPDAVLAMLRPLVTPAREAALESEGFCSFSEQVLGVGRYRAHLALDSSGLSAAFRVFPNKLRSFEELGLSPLLEQVATWDHGLVLCVGPAGAGKTTTMAAMIDALNERRSVRIVTIEDPIEVRHSSKSSLVSQRSYDSPTAFERQLRLARQEGAEVLAFGELNNEQTIRAAVEAAHSGALVLATMNGARAVDAIERLVFSFDPDQYVEARSMIADSLRLVHCQQLVASAEGGRAPIVELLWGIPAVLRYVRQNRMKHLVALMRAGGSLNLRTFEDSMAALVKSGVVTRDAAAAAKSGRAVTGEDAGAN